MHLTEIPIIRRVFKENVKDWIVRIPIVYFAKQFCSWKYAVQFSKSEITQP